MSKLQTVDRAGQGLGQGGFLEGQPFGDRRDRSVPQNRLVQEHVLLKASGKLIAYGVVDGTVGAHAVGAPVAGAAGNIRTQGHPVSFLDAGDLGAHFDDLPGDLMADHRRVRNSIVAVVIDADVRTAHRAGPDLENRLVGTADRGFHVPEDNPIAPFQYCRFHHWGIIADWRNS